MINNFNEPIFNYIFSINEDIRAGIKNDSNEYRKMLDEKISRISEIKDFWYEYKYYFNDGFIIMAKTLGGTIIRYNNFPRMTLDTKKVFFEYKFEQIKKCIYNNGEFMKDETEKIFLDIENIGRKVILDYCRENGLIEYKGTPYIKADDNPAYAILYDNIKAIIKTNNNSGMFEQNIYQNINYGDNYGTFTQNNNIEDNDDELYKIVIDKLDLIQSENKLSGEKINILKKACEKKEKNKVIKILKDLALSTSSNLIASGILKMFGLM